MAVSFESTEAAYQIIADALNYLEANGEDMTNENLQDEGPLVIEGNSAGVYWNFNTETFYVKEG